MRVFGLITEQSAPASSRLGARSRWAAASARKGARCTSSSRYGQTLCRRKREEEEEEEEEEDSSIIARTPKRSTHVKETYRAVLRNRALEKSR